MPGVKLRVVIHIESAPDGKLSAKLDSPDQGSKGIPVSDVTFADSVLSVTSKAIGGSFSGKLAGGEISGHMETGGRRTPLGLEACRQDSRARPARRFRIDRIRTSNGISPSATKPPA